MVSSTNLIDTPVEDIASIVKEVDATFKSRKTQPIEWRKEQLKQLWRLLDEHNDDLLEALHKDSSKLAMESQAFDISPVKGDILHMLAKLDEWLAPEVVDVPSPYENWQPTIYKQPKGTVVVISPWNYPVVLTLLPLIGVIASGDTAIIKPSEVSAHSAEILTRLLPQYLDKDAYRFVNGGPQVVTALLKHQFGHIIYTGGTNIGRIVMGAAAKTLTPVTLELGGKSPVVVTKNANLPLAAKRLAWGKFWYSGQTCVAPDFLIVEESVADEFTGLLQAVSTCFVLASDHY
jgi:acyl-CoA reductase-like NAD-dependent aldehyde dehydrogenase